MSRYTEYGMAHEPEVLEVVRPATAGFAAKYLASLSPLVALGVYSIAALLINPIIGIILSPFDFVASIFGIHVLPVLMPVLPLLLVLLLVAWVMNSDEATASILIALLISALAAVVVGNPKAFSETLPAASLVASFVVLLRTELFRRSIEYVIDDTGIELKGGLIRKQGHRIPYNQIGRIVVERSILGRILNYGTVIPVGVADWGAEYYTRAFGVADGIAAGYARTVKEVARDPLKCLYGIRDPEIAAEKLGKMISVPFRADVDQVEYLKKIYEAVTVA